MHTYADFCKHLITDSYHNPSAPNYNSLILPAPPMPTDETRPMDSGDGKPSAKYFSEDGKDGTKPVSVHRWCKCCVLTIKVDTRNETRSLLQCAFPSPLLDYNINSPTKYTIEYTPKTVHSNRTTLSTRTTALSARSRQH